MTDQLDDAFIAEARRQGLQPDRDAMMAVAIALAGSKVDGDRILTPDNKSIMLKDAVRGFHASQPESFQRIDGTKDESDHGYAPETLTARYIEENRRNKQSGKPVDAERYSGLTLSMMNEIAQKKANR